MRSQIASLDYCFRFICHAVKVAIIIILFYVYLLFVYGCNKVFLVIDLGLMYVMRTQKDSKNGVIYYGIRKFYFKKV